MRYNDKYPGTKTNSKTHYRAGADHVFYKRLFSGSDSATALHKVHILSFGPDQRRATLDPVLARLVWYQPLVPNPCWFLAYPQKPQISDSRIHTPVNGCLSELGYRTVHTIVCANYVDGHSFKKKNYPHYLAAANSCPELVYPLFIRSRRWVVHPFPADNKRRHVLSELINIQARCQTIPLCESAQTAI